jgi:hypothetical protein
MPRLTQLNDVLFPVNEHPIIVIFQAPGGEQRLPVPNKKAVVNQMTHRVLGIVSRGYRLMTNREALDMARECCRAVFPETKSSEWETKAAEDLAKSQPNTEKNGHEALKGRVFSAGIS